MAYMLQSNWIRAYIDGRRGKNLLAEAVELRPDFHDAWLGLGYFHYYVATLPSYLEVLARLLLLGGDREEGMREIEHTARLGYYAVAQAKMTLVDIYTDFEERPAEAMTILRELRTRYPENIWLDGNKDQIHVHLAEYDSALAIEAAFIDSCRSGARYFKSKWIPHIRFKMGVCYFRKGDYAEAEKIFIEVAAVAPENPEWVHAWALVQLGMTLDVTGRRDEAIETYKRVLKMKNRENSHKWARVFLAIRCQKKDNRVYPTYFWNGAPFEGRYSP
jgi:tetratricopeptide (TPR) repeat protein